MPSNMKKTIIALAFAATGVLAQTTAPTLEQIKIAADAGDPVAQDKLAEKMDSAQAEILYRKSSRTRLCPCPRTAGRTIIPTLPFDDRRQTRNLGRPR